jgi:hypothetical protein
VSGGGCGEEKERKGEKSFSEVNVTVCPFFPWRKVEVNATMNTLQREPCQAAAVGKKRKEKEIIKVSPRSLRP